MVYQYFVTQKNEPETQNYKLKTSMYINTIVQYIRFLQGDTSGDYKRALLTVVGSY